MALARQTCVHHPDRLAIGVCVITRQPICAECSTRYEGVNYSKEGLRILQQRRAAEAKGGGATARAAWTTAAVISWPVLLLMAYGFYYFSAWTMITLEQQMRK